MELTIDLTNLAQVKDTVYLLEQLLDLRNQQRASSATGELFKDTPVLSAAPLAPSAPSTAAVFSPPNAPVAPQPSVTSPTVPQPPVALASPPVHAAPTPPAGSVELDVKGLPWDGRIHSSSKAKNADGQWRAKKGLNDGALVARVEAELRAVPQAPAPTDAAVVFGGAAAPAPLPLTAPGVAIMPTATASVGGDPQTFEQLMPRVSAAVIAGTLPPTAIGDACTGLGLPSVMTLQTSPQFVPHVWAALVKLVPEL